MSAAFLPFELFLGPFHADQKGMRVALFHNTYRFRGGEDVVVDAEEAILTSLGAEVVRLQLDNTAVFDPPGPRAVHDLAFAPFNRERARQVAKFLKRTKSEVGHVHNWFPLFSPSIYAAHRKVGVPVIQTLHNYRLGCAAGTMTRGGQHCQLCLGGDRQHAVEHRCYRGSKLLTRMWQRVVQRGWDTGGIHEPVDRFLAPTAYVADVHVALGLPKEKVEILPHGVPDPGASPEPGTGALFVGRLSEEKGIATLLEAWNSLSVPLTIVGTGPLEDVVRQTAAAHPMIKYVGPASPEEVRTWMDKAAFVVSPHLAPETFGLVVVEALAKGRAVVASDIGGPSSILSDGITGRLVRPGDERALADAVQELHGNRQAQLDWGKAARASYTGSYTLEAHGRRLLDVFADACGSQRSGLAA